MYFYFHYDQMRKMWLNLANKSYMRHFTCCWFPRWNFIELRKEVFVCVCFHSVLKNSFSSCIDMYGSCLPLYMAEVMHTLWCAFILRQSKGNFNRNDVSCSNIFNTLHPWQVTRSSLYTPNLYYIVHYYAIWLDTCFI